MWYYIFCPGVVEPKSITPVFDHLVGGGYACADLAVLIDFWFDEGGVLELLGLLLLFGPCGLLLFTAISLTDGMVVESGLDSWLPCNDRILLFL
jgi:hypothetical protein